MTETGEASHNRIVPHIHLICDQLITDPGMQYSLVRHPVGSVEETSSSVAKLLFSVENLRSSQRARVTSNYNGC